MGSLTNKGGGVLAGTVAYFGASSAPAGWLKANGAAVSRAAYASLFLAIGTIYGVGDGATTFNLPDIRGEFVRGFDDGRGVDSGRTLGSAQNQDMQPHQHSVKQAGVGVAGSTAWAHVDTVSGTLPGSYSKTEIEGTAETRPRNIAFLGCIKY